MANFDLNLRTFEPKDEPECRKLFRSGMVELVTPLYIIEMKSLAKIILLVLPIVLAITWSWRVVLAALAVCAVISAVKYVMVYHAMITFVNKSLAGDLQDISKHYLQEGSCMFIAVLQDKVVGMAAVTHNDSHKPDVAEIFRMSVNSSIRKRGIATKLLKCIFEFCRENNYKKIILGTSNGQKAAMKLYEKHGFQEMNRFRPSLLVHSIKIVRYEKHLD